MTDLDLEVLPEVVAILEEFGRDATFIVRSKTYGDAEVTSGQTTYGSEPNVVAKCTPPWPYDLSFRDGDVVTQGHAKIYVAGQDLAFTPKTGMQVVIDGRTWTVLVVTPISSGEQNAAWAMEIER